MMSAKPSPLTFPRGGDRPAAVVVGSGLQCEAVGAVQDREVEAGTEPRGPAEHDVALAGIIIGGNSADDDIGEAIAVDVAGPGDGRAALVTRIDTVKPEAVGAVEVGERGG